MKRGKSIRVGIWGYDNDIQIFQYIGELKKILYNMSIENHNIVLVCSLDGKANEMILIVSKLLGIGYDVWLSSKPSQYTQKFNDMEYAIFNRVLFGARGYKIVPFWMESAVISNDLDVLILLKDGKIHIANISIDKDKVEERQNE